MNLFYTPQLIEPQFRLDAEESKHLTKVLRKQAGETITTTDGKGFFYECKLLDTHPKGCRMEVVDKKAGNDQRDFRLSMGVAPTKNINRYEWFLEKATELGIDEIIPFYSFHSERRDVRTDRLEKVMVAAMKQSLKSNLPVLREPVKFQQLINQPFDGEKYIAYIHPEVTLELSTASTPKRNTLILIGPEGDFSTEEIEQAKQAGFVPVRLGLSRLRTETAAIAACHTLHLINMLKTKP